MGWIFARRIKKLDPLFTLMEEIGAAHGLSCAQVALAFVATKGIVSVCGCRKPEQVQELYDASHTELLPSEMEQLEQCADELGVHIFGKDIFRFFVRK